MKLSRVVEGQIKLHLRISEKACDKRESLLGCPEERNGKT